MKKLTLEAWEKEYIVGPVERFDEKYTMFSRPLWDEKVKHLLNWVLDKTASKRKAGNTLLDQALRVASRTGTMMHLFENDRPNPSAIAREIGAVATPEKVARNIMVSLPPPDEKWDTSDPATLTRDVKNAAIYFGADMVGICKLDRRWIYATVRKTIFPHFKTPVFRFLTNRVVLPILLTHEKNLTLIFSITLMPSAGFSTRRSA